jgi:hypothetical protein
MTLRDLKKKVVDLFVPNEETSEPDEGTTEECWQALEEFLAEVHKENNVSEEELQDFQQRAKNGLISDTMNDIISLLEVSVGYSQYELNNLLDRYADVVSLYSCAIAVGRSKS